LQTVMHPMHGLKGKIPTSCVKKVHDIVFGFTLFYIMRPIISRFTSLPSSCDDTSCGGIRDDGNIWRDKSVECNDQF